MVKNKQINKFWFSLKKVPDETAKIINFINSRLFNIHLFGLLWMNWEVLLPYAEV